MDAKAAFKRVAFACACVCAMLALASGDDHEYTYDVGDYYASMPYYYHPYHGEHPHAYHPDLHDVGTIETGGLASGTAGGFASNLFRRPFTLTNSDAGVLGEASANADGTANADVEDVAVGAKVDLSVPDIGDDDSSNAESRFKYDSCGPYGCVSYNNKYKSEYEAPAYEMPKVATRMMRAKPSNEKKKNKKDKKP